MSKNIFISFLLFTMCVYVHGQSTYNMTNALVTDCEGVHKDSDAQFGGRYGTNEDFTFTICVGDPNAQILYTFTSFNMEPTNDSIWFLDGPNAASPFIAGYTGNFSGIPPTVIANSGCLTIRFRSDATVNFNGWTANWTTVAPVPVKPVMTFSPVTPPTCGSSTFQVNFSSKVKCDSIKTSSFSFTGTNAPTITNVTPIACSGDSATAALVTLNANLAYNCKYILQYNLNVRDLCDSLFPYVLKDSLTFTTCPLLTSVTPDQTICYGECTDLSASVFAGCNTYSYAWNNGLPATAGPHNVCPITNTAYIVTITEIQTGIIKRDTINITVSDTLNSAVDFDFSIGNAPSCGSSSFNVIFSPAIVCSLLDSGNFVLSSPNLPPSVIGVTALNCTNNLVDSVRIDLNTNLVSNCTYQLDYNLVFTDLCNGSVNRTLTDNFTLSTCPLSATLIYPDTICIGNCDDVTAIANGCSAFTYSWSNGLPPTAGPHSICPNGDTTFYVTITETATGLTIQDTVSIQAFPQGVDLTMELDPVLPKCFDQTVVVNFSPSIHCGAIQGSSFTILGGPMAPNVTGASPIICVGGEATAVVINLDSTFDYNCDYVVQFTIDTTDECGNLLSLVFLDTFRVVDCELPDTVTHEDTICGGNATTLLVQEVSTCFGLHYVWSNGLPDSPGPHTILPTGDTTITVIITEDTTGKVTYDTVNIIVDNSFIQYGISIDSAIGIPGCDSTTIYVKFPVNVQQDSIYTAAFALTGGASPPTIVNVIPTNIIGDSTRTATITLSNSFPGNCLYTVAFTAITPFCSTTVNTSFNITNCVFTGGLTYNDTVCFNSNTNVTFSSNSCYPLAYTWSNGLPAFAGPHVITPTKDTVFSVIVTETMTGFTIYDTVRIKFINTAISPVPQQCTYNAPFNLVAAQTGGTWSGPGITNSSLGTFNPGVSGPGLHTITYSLLGCTNTITITVTNPDAGPDRVLCNSGIPATLTGSPSGGTWSGPFISAGGSFTPSTYGTYKVFYTVNSCTDSTTVFVDSISKVYSADTVCRYDAPFNIPISPSGGVWSGPGITNSSAGTFNPAFANSGNNTVLYTYVTCVDTVRIFVQDITIGSDMVVCPLQPQFNLAPGSPTSGVWDGVGIVNTMTGLYDPAIIGNNQRDTITYTFNGCYDTLYIDVIQTDIQVDTLAFCLNELPIQLIGSVTNPITPPGGVWTGNGVRQLGPDYYFYPDSAGTGVHKLIYDQNSCSDSIYMTVYPDTLAYKTLTICNTASDFDIFPPHNIPGATWVGPGIINPINGRFSPANAPIGNNVIHYVNPAFNCNDSLVITVYPYVDAAITFPDTLCYLSYDSIIDVVPSGGTWGGTGVYDQVNGIFNSATAGNGLHQITYEFGVGQCYTADTTYVYVRRPLAVTVIASDYQLCPGETSDLVATANNGNTNNTYMYTWDHTANTNNNQTVNPPITQTFTVTANDGCSDPASTNVVIDVYPKPVSTLSTSPLVCFGTEGFVTYDTSQANHTYTWINPPTIGDTVFIQSPDSVDVRITTSDGCFMDTSITIESYSYIYANFDISPDLLPDICLTFNDPKVRFTDQSAGGLTGNWDIGETSFAYAPGDVVDYEYQNGGKYIISLTIKNEGPCFDTAIDSVCVLKEPIFVPDIFSPNNDGENDILFARGQQIEKIEFHVFDRWGQKLFLSRDVTKGWNGTVNGVPANAGVYVYYVKALLQNGEVYELKGDVTLVR